MAFRKRLSTICKCAKALTVSVGLTAVKLLTDTFHSAAGTVSPPADGRTSTPPGNSCGHRG